MKKVFLLFSFALTVSLSNAQIFLNENWAGSNSAWDNIWRVRSVCVDAYSDDWGGPSQQRETGFILRRDFGGNDADWGGHWLGFQRGNSAKLNLSTGTQTADPVMMNGYWGIGMRTMSGKMAMTQNGVVVIGEFPKSTLRLIAEKINYWDNPYKLYVADGIRTEKIKVDLQSTWGDYVFKKDYNLLPLSMVEQNIAAEGHLPDMPSAETLQTEGLDLGNMATKQQVKIEEIFLHLIEMEKRVKAVEAENAALKLALSHR
jgi:hypothetical protein